MIVVLRETGQCKCLTWFKDCTFKLDYTIMYVDVQRYMLRNLHISSEAKNPDGHSSLNCIVLQSAPACSKVPRSAPICSLLLQSFS